MKNLRVFAKRKDSDEKLKGTGINIIGDTAILYNQYASYEVEPETVLLRADNHMMEEYNNPTTNSKLAFQLHEKLVQTIIDFMADNHIDDVEEVQFSADSLQISKQYRKWTPATDSGLTLFGYQDGKRKKIIESI